MNTRKIASEYRLSQWAEILRERGASGQSIKEFCKTAGFHENVYYYWQRKLREAACEELAARAQTEAVKGETSLVPRGWTICETAEPATSGKALVVEIGAYRVRVETDTDPELLAKVCQVLISLC